ncbi:MAG: flagellar assembly protein FliW [Lachnospiraceae bacterium]|nr:flagellar assembly protein FliW [Lachnospiraceae bacterium]MCI5587467.1 flagellar assembly protein FliW [Lachnospiraceae bacterium]
MIIDTKYFGTIDIGEEKIIHFDNGLLGFEEYKDYTILYDIDEEEKPLFSWLQSVDEKGLAFPVVNPLDVDENYNPTVDDEILNSLGDINEENMIVLLLATIPKDVKEASVNMRAPLVINSDNRKGMQIIVENKEYEIKHKIIK